MKLPRATALRLIKGYAAEGDMRAATRIYLDSCISREAFNEAVRAGMKFGKFIAQRDAAKSAE